VLVKVKPIGLVELVGPARSMGSDFASLAAEEVFPTHGLHLPTSGDVSSSQLLPGLAPRPRSLRRRESWMKYAGANAKAHTAIRMATSFASDRRGGGGIQLTDYPPEAVSVTFAADLRINHVDVINTQSQAARPTVVPFHEDLNSVRVQDGASQSYSESPSLNPVPLARDVLQSS
jgi:hypothetical protein